MEDNKENPTVLKSDEKRFGNFSVEMKKKLAAQVKAHPRIWDVNDRLHFRKVTHELSWLAISKVIGRPVSECKATWESMKETYYALIKENGDSHITEEVAFLPSVAQKRKAFDMYDQSSSDSSDARYQYALPKRNREEDSDTKMLDRLAELIQSQEKLLKLRAEAESSTSKFKTVLSTFDWLLNQLPQDVADEAIEEITGMLMNKVRQESLKK